MPHPDHGGLDELAGGQDQQDVRLLPGRQPGRWAWRGRARPEVGRRPRYYTDDGEDALVMTTPELSGATMQAVLAAERARLSSSGDDA